ncbi:MAG: helix-turn-helix domain-containing protein [Clostridia bacterium]
MNEKGFALLMNVAPSTVRLWTSGAAQPCGTAKRLMQIYETGPEIVGKIAGGQPTGRWEGLIKWRGQIASRLRKMSRSKSCFT